MILEDEGPEDIASEAYFTDPTYAQRSFADRPARTYYETPREPPRIAEPPVRPEPLREAPARFEAPEHPADEIGRVTRALDRLTERIEVSEGRTGMAITGVEHSVREAVARIESAEREHVAIAARFEGAVDETRTEQARLADRLRRVEAEANGPRSAEALRALEQALGRVANHLYQGESETRQTLAALRERVERAEAGDPKPGVEVIEEVVGRVESRLSEAEARTADALDTLRASFSGLDGRLASIEGGATPGLDERLEQLSARFSQRLDDTRGELAKTLQASTESRFDRMERKLSEMAEQVRVAEQRSAQAIERVGREVLTVADTLNRRVESSEARNAEAIEQVGGEVARIAQTVEAKLSRTDTIQAQALEKLGVEIGRISERLAERISNAERRSAQAIDDVGEQLARVNERIAQRGERASDDLVERIRLSEERTARLLEEAREKIDQRLGEVQGRISEQVAAGPAAHGIEAADPVRLFGEPEPFPSLDHEAPIPAPAPSRSAMQAASLMTRSGFATPPPRPTGSGAPVAAPAPLPSFAPIPPVVAEAFDAPSVYAPEPFPAEAQRPTFDADDFEAADGLTSLEEEEAHKDIEPEADGFAPELELAEEHHAPVEEPAHLETDLLADAAHMPAPPPVLETREAEEVEEEQVHRPAIQPEPEAAHFEASAFDSTEDEEDEEHHRPRFNLQAFQDDQEAHPEPFAEHQASAEPAATAEPVQPLSTREVIEQARAAARAAVQNDGKGRKPKPQPRPTKSDDDASGGSAGGGSLFSLFGRRPKRRAGSSLQTALVVVGGAAAVSVGAAGFVLMGSHPGGAPPKRVAEAIAALSGGKVKTGPEADTTPFPGNPRVSMALAPQPVAPAAPVAPTAPDLSDRFAEAARGVEANKPGALTELKAVAELGHAPAQFYLARLYEKGEGGLKPDPVAARRWTERAAEGGDRRAMHNLGMAYINGVAGPKNSTTAAQWFRRAADLGLVDSQFNLAALYEKGLGVSQNPAEAYKWYLIAAKTGDGDARKRADQVKAQLSPDARVVAEQAAQAFRATAANPTAAAPVATADVGAGTGDTALAQRALSRLGYYLGPTDGTATPALKLAVAAYQRDHNAPVTGDLDPNTIKGLSIYTR